MKKILALCLAAVLCLCCLASCGGAHKENEWFSEEKLTNCLVGDLPTIEKDYVNHNGEDIYVSFTDSEFKAYVKSVYDYLCSQEYKYLGTRGEQKNTLAGAFTTYYFEPATELESFRVLEGDYVFVFSDGSTDENGDVEFIILVIYDVSTNTLEYGNKKFTYNTMISLRRGSETPLSGFYVLKCPFAWVGKDEGHHKLALCNCCDYPIELEPHVDADSNNKCDICQHDFYVYYLRYYATCLEEIDVNDIDAIKFTNEYVGVAPGMLKESAVTTDETVIARVLDELQQLTVTPIPRENGEIAGGSATTITLYLKDGSKEEIYINNGNYYTGDYGNYKGEYYKLDYLPSLRESDNASKSYGFITYIGTGVVYDKDNNSVCEIPIDELEFVESDGCVDAVVTGYYYTVETEFGTLYFDYSNDLFYLQFEEGEVDYIEYYQLVGKNLDELIAEYSATSTD